MLQISSAMIILHNAIRTGPRVSLCACAMGVWLMYACVFVAKTMPVRIFQSAKLTNF